MIEELNFEIDAVEESMQAAIEHLERELTNVRAGKANPSMLRSVFVEYYGANTPLNQVANLSVEDARTLIIKPWDKKMLSIIERAIFGANLGFTPQNNGEIIRINLPQMTQERRRKLAKQVKGIGETAKIAVRKARGEGNTGIKALVKEGLSEDMGKDGQERVQNLTKTYSGKIDVLVTAKEKEIMSL